MAFEVQTETFSGPFDLLLHLILRDEVDLYEISLAEIVDAYLAEIERIDLCDLEVATEFLLIAATLVELKCRRLLPVDANVDLDEELGLWEERDLLLSRLLECKTFKDASKMIDQLAQHAALSMPRRVGLEDRFIDLSPDLLSGVRPDDLRRAFLRIASARPLPQVSLRHVTIITASVNDAIATMLDELPTCGPTTFRRLVGGLTDRIEVVVRFLAVLELFKQGMVEIDQSGVFGDLIIRWTGLGPTAIIGGAGSTEYPTLDGPSEADPFDRDAVLTGVDTYEG